MRRALLLLALVCASAAQAKPPPKDAPAAPAPAPSAPAAPAIPTVSDAQKVEAFKTYEEAMRSGNKTSAADALLPILDNPALTAVHGEAWVKLGDILASFDMEYSALIAYDHGIAADPTVAAFKVGPAMDLAAKMGDERLLGPTLAANVGIEVDKETRSRMAFIAARHHFQEGNYGTTAAILRMVDKESPVYPRAEALRGVTLVQQGQYNDALVPFVTAAAMSSKVEDPERFENVLNLNVGRAYFAAGNFPRSIEYFAKVDRESGYWPEATFERAWAHFRLEDMNGTLGLLHNHSTPFFADWYYPEASLLRVYSLFLLCKFPSAGTEIDAFKAQYTPVREELDRTLSGMTPEQAWADAVAYSKGGQTTLPSMVLRPYGNEDRFLGALKSVEKSEDELTRLKSASANPFTQRAREGLQARHDDIVRAEGERMLKGIRARRDELGGMLDNVEITKIDILQFETQLYEKAAATGKLDYGDRIGELRKLRKAKGTRVWPYEGEFWADELGYYRYDVRPDCPDSMRVGEAAK